MGVYHVGLEDAMRLSYVQIAALLARIPMVREAAGSCPMLGG